MSSDQSLSTEFPPLDEDDRDHYVHYLRDELVFFYFCLARNQNTQHIHALRQRLHDVLTTFRYLQDQGKDSTYEDLFVQFYKMIGHTRDYFLGKGEHQVSYFLLWVWYDHYPRLVEDAIQHFVYDIDDDVAGYGSWRDMKYLCEFLKIHSSRGEEHPLICFCISLMNKQLDRDVETWKFSTNALCPDALSHVAKWIPREKKHFDWLFRKLAIHWVHTHHPYILASAKRRDRDSSYRNALVKCYTMYRKVIASMNKSLQTLEVKLCARQYYDIAPTNVPKFSLARQRSFFLLPDDDPVKQRSYQKIQSYYYDTHDNYVPPCGNSDDMSLDNLNAFYANYTPGYFVKEAYSLLSREDVHTEKVTKHLRYLNLVWAKQSHLVSMFQLSGFLPVVDISSKMHLHNRDPLYHAIGMAICVAFYQQGDFSKRILLIDNVPTWVSLTGCGDFVSCVKEVMRVLKDSPNTVCNLYNAFSFVSSPLFHHCFPAYPPTHYIKCLVFSYDPEIPCMKSLDELFSSQQQVLPSFVFWNVYSDFSYCDHEKTLVRDRFSELLREKGYLFLSGTSFYLLRSLQYICQDSTSQTFISSILRQSRLEPMESLCMAHFE